MASQLVGTALLAAVSVLTWTGRLSVLWQLFHIYVPFGSLKDSPAITISAGYCESFCITILAL